MSSEHFTQRQTLRPRALDLFCCAGGMAKGLHDAGFEVIGVDIIDQPHYPYEFHRFDAVELLEYCVRGCGALGGRPLGRFNYGLRDFDYVHASPPCQAYSDLKTKLTFKTYPKLIEPVRDLLMRSGKPYTIENVPEAPMLNPVILCGTMFLGLRVIRHRAFESNLPLTAPAHPGKHPLVFTHDKRKRHYGKLDQSESFVQVTGGGNCSIVDARDAMGIDWMNKHELNEAIPPAYGEFIGRQVLRQLQLEKAA